MPRTAGSKEKEKTIVSLTGDLNVVNSKMVGNESKQTKIRDGKKAAVSMKSKRGKTNSSSKVQAQIHNEDEILELEVEGMGTEFCSETEDLDETAMETEDSESKTEDAVMMEAGSNIEFKMWGQMASTNNNALRGINNPHPKNAMEHPIKNQICDSRAATEVDFGSSSADKQRQEWNENVINNDPEEQAFFTRFHDFLEKKGMKLVKADDTGKESEESGGERRKDKMKKQEDYKEAGTGKGNVNHKGQFNDAHSETTIYQAAVRQINEVAKDLSSNLLKRFSSSSEEGDLSDEMRDLEIDANDSISIVGSNREDGQHQN